MRPRIRTGYRRRVERDPRTISYLLILGAAVLLAIAVLLIGLEGCRKAGSGGGESDTEETDGGPGGDSNGSTGSGAEDTNGLPEDGDDLFDTDDTELADFSDVLADLEQVMPLLSDIEPVPLPPEIDESDDPNLEPISEIINAVNGYDRELAYPEDSYALGPLASGGWKRRCDVTEEQVYCTFTKTKGELTYRVTEVITAVHRSWRLDLDGYDGKYHYDNFRCTDELSFRDGTYSRERWYTNPDHDPLPPGPLWEWTWNVMEATDESVFSPWQGGGSVAHRTHTCVTYTYNGRDAYYDSQKDVVVDLGGAVVRFEAWIRPAEWEDMHLWYMAIHYTDSHTGRCYTYNSSGTMSDYGSW